MYDKLINGALNKLNLLAKSLVKTFYFIHSVLVSVIIGLCDYMLQC